MEFLYVESLYVKWCLYIQTSAYKIKNQSSVKPTSGKLILPKFITIISQLFNNKWLENKHIWCIFFPNIQQGEQLPWSNDCTERLQHLSCSKPLLRVQHQQLSDQAHCVLRHTAVPVRRWRTERASFVSKMWPHESTEPLLKDYTAI